MAKVLVVDSDSVFAAVLADRLHVAGHEVRRLSDGGRAAATAQEQQVDLVVLGGFAQLGAPRGRGPAGAVRDAVGADPDALRPERRRRPGGRPAGRRRRLSRPPLRSRRAAAAARTACSPTAPPPSRCSRGISPITRSGPCSSISARCARAASCGSRGRPARGRSRCATASPPTARWQGQLRGRQALLALLSLEEGGFRFDPLLARRATAGLLRGCRSRSC